MAHTVQSLSKLLKKTPDEMLEVLKNAGIEGKTADSEISAEERGILMGGSFKRRSNTQGVLVSHSKDAGSGVKIQVKKKHQEDVKEPAISDAERLKAQKILEANKVEEQLKSPPKPAPKPIPEPPKPISKPVTPQKPAAKPAHQKPTTKPAKPKSPQKPKPSTPQKPLSTKRPKSFHDKKSGQRHQLHIKNKNTNRKLKKKDRTRLSQKIREEQAQHAFVKPVAAVIHEVSIPENIKIADLAQKMTTKAGEVLKVLMSMGVMATLNDVIDQDTALLVVEEMGHIGIASHAETIEDRLLTDDADIGESIHRPPVVTIMGHVDHGKTSLLDYIRKTKAADAEAGGITQHIGAYQVDFNNKPITFIDTPGHAAFAKMRSRGANATDIVVLVVAADDGVMPQTIESIKHAKASNVPIIVAINKIDKEGVEIDKVKQALSANDVISEDWGGEVMMVPVSAHSGEGIDALLDAINLTAEILEINAAVDAPAHGLVLEARLDKGRGKITTILVQSGTLKVGDIVIAGLEYGKVKRIMDDTGKVIKTATPSMPVEILGLSGVPSSGDEILAVDSEKKAREVTDFRKTKSRENELQSQQAVKMENFLSKMEEGEVQAVNVLIKSDVRGSAEAISEALTDLATDEIKVKIIFSGVGAINNTDISLASAANAIVFGFNVRADAVARKTADVENVKIEYYSIIYNLIDDVKAMMGGMLSPEFSENIIGIATVKDVFKSQKMGDIAGCIVEEGVVKRDSAIRVLRDSVVVFEGELESLRRFKDDVKEVKSGVECGIGVQNYTDVQPGDQIEVFERIERPRSL